MLGTMLRKHFLFLFALILVFFSFIAPTFAQEDPVSSETAMMVDQKSTYTLPFPGMLPDNPLYFLKAMRDGVIGFLISDPLKKTQFDLLKADKKVAEAVYLVNHKQNESLAISSSTEGQEFFEDAIMQIEKARASGMNTTQLLSDMNASSQKQEEVLSELYKVTGNKTFENQAKKAGEFRKSVIAIQEQE